MNDSQPEPDFEALIGRIAQGGDLDFGNAAERQKRTSLRASISELQLSCPTAGAVAVAENRQPYLVINFIISLFGVFPSRAAADAVTEEVKKETARIENELAKPEPDVLVVARSAQRLKEIKHWLAGKGDVFADNFAKSFGTSAGVTAVAGAAGLLSPLSHVIHAAGQWLHAVTG